MGIVLWVLLGAVVFTYGVVPLLARRQFWFSASPGPRLIPPGHFGADIAATAEQLGAQVAVLGFTHLADVTVPDSMPDTTLHHRLLADEARTIVSAVTITVAGDRPPRAMTTFGSRSPTWDGRWREITTTNSAEYLPLRPPDDIVHQRPEESAAELLATHREALASLAPIELWKIDDPVDALRQDLERVVEHGVATGLFVADGEVPGRQRLSVPGAYRVVWANMPPMTWLRRRRA